MKVELNLGNYVDFETYMSGLHEESWILEARKLTGTKVFVDVGANIGVYTLGVADRAVRVYAFEPGRDNFKNLTINVGNNALGNVETIKKAVSEKNGIVRLYIDKADAGRHSLVAKSRRFERVGTVSLDYFVKKNNIKNIGLVKIDVEGSEMGVLLGAEELITKRRFPILIEVNAPLLMQCGHSAFDIYDFLISRSYGAYRMVDGKLRGINRDYLRRINSENLLFKAR